MRLEYDALLKKNTRVLVPPTNKKVIDSKWVWWVKGKPLKTIEKLKSRLCCLGV